MRMKVMSGETNFAVVNCNSKQIVLLIVIIQCGVSPMSNKDKDQMVSTT